MKRWPSSQLQNQTQCTEYPVDEDRLNELDELEGDLETDWNEIVVENDESQQTEEKVCLFKT